MVCSALLSWGCAETPADALTAAQAAWARGNEAALGEHLTAPSAGMMRLLAFCDERFRVTPRGEVEAAGNAEVPVPEGASTFVVRLAGASGAVPLRLVREGRGWKIDLVASEALARDEGGRGVAP